MTSWTIGAPQVWRAGDVESAKSSGRGEIGIHARPCPSNTVANDYYPMLAKILFELAVRLQRETGVHIKFINLSGGIGISYTPDPGAQRYPHDRRRRAQGV
ncbi:MAG: hypothetical protein ACLTT1_13435 [[Clostridium] scindens]